MDQQKFLLTLETAVRFDSRTIIYLRQSGNVRNIHKLGKSLNNCGALSENGC